MKMQNEPRPQMSQEVDMEPVYFLCVGSAGE